MNIRLVSVAFLALCLEAAYASPVTIDTGSFLRDRAFSYGDPLVVTQESIVTPGITTAVATTGSGNASSSTTATLNTGSTGASFRIDTSQGILPTGAWTNTWLELYFTTTQVMNYVLSGSLQGSSADSSQEYKSLIALALMPSLVSIALERDATTVGNGTLSVDGSGTEIIGLSTGSIGPGSYAIRMQTGLNDLGDFSNATSLAGVLQLDLTTVTVPAPAPLLPFLVGILFTAFRLRR